MKREQRRKAKERKVDVTSESLIRFGCSCNMQTVAAVNLVNGYTCGSNSNSVSNSDTVLGRVGDEGRRVQCGMAQRDRGTIQPAKMRSGYQL